MEQEKKKKNLFLKILQIICRIIIGLFVFLLLLNLGVELYFQIKYKPIKVGSADEVEMIEIDYYGYGDKLLEIEITDAEDMQALIEALENLKGKRISPWGVKDLYEPSAHFRVTYASDYSESKLGYCLIYGDQIMLTEGGHYPNGYRISEEDAKEFWDFVAQLIQ
ncbi:MAG: hypothetical protein J1E61_08790 [Lachnospiraceae bacterium]|nr:hypothetical protein [Lachnospiraceae bacterium]